MTGNIFLYGIGMLDKMRNEFLQQKFTQTIASSQGFIYRVHKIRNTDTTEAPNYNYLQVAFGLEKSFTMRLDFPLVFS